MSNMLGNFRDFVLTVYRLLTTIQTAEAAVPSLNPASTTVENSESLRTGRVTVYSVKSRLRVGNLPLRPKNLNRPMNTDHANMLPASSSRKLKLCYEKILDRNIYLPGKSFDSMSSLLANCPQEEVTRRLGRGGREGADSQQPAATPLLRLRLLDLDGGSDVIKQGTIGSGLLTVWRPDGQLGGLLEEGRVLGLAGCQVGRQEGSSLHLTATRATQYQDIGRRVAQADLPPHTERRLVSIGSVGAGVASFRPPFNEVDLVGWVLAVGEPRPADFQHVYVCDRETFQTQNTVYADLKFLKAF